jgi:hypothetical protein
MLPPSLYKIHHLVISINVKFRWHMHATTKIDGKLCIFGIQRKMQELITPFKSAVL